MNIVFIMVAITLWLLVFGWPVWLLIWGLWQKKKTGKFPWKKVILIAVVAVLLNIVLNLVSRNILNGIMGNYGTEKIGPNLDVTR